MRQRVQRMVDAGVMQIVAVTDPMQLGFARQAMIGIRCTGDTTKIAEKLAAIDAVDYVVLTAGSFDAIVEVVCEDDDRPPRAAQHPDPRIAGSDIHRNPCLPETC